MIRISTIFIAICMVLVAASLGLVLYSVAGINGTESAIVALTALTFLILYNAVSMRLRDRNDVGGQIADLSRGTADLARQVAEFGRRLATIEGRIASSNSTNTDRIQSVAGEINELGGLVRQLATTVSTHEDLLAGHAPAASPAPIARPEPEAQVDPTAPPDESHAAPPPIPAVAPRPTQQAVTPPAMTPPAAPTKTANAVQTVNGRNQTQMLATLRNAIDENRIDIFLQPMVTLPQRKVRFYEAVTRVRDGRDQLIAAEEFISLAEASGLIGRIDNMVMLRCVQVLRRLMVRNKDVGVFCNVASSTLGNSTSFAQCLDFLEANRALAPSLVLEFKQSTFRNLGPAETENLAALAQRGFRFSIDHVTDLRIEPRELADRGVRFIKVPASLLLDPRQASTSDIHPSDLSDLLGRFGIDLIAERIEGERAVVDLLDYDVRFGQGFLFAPPRPLRPDGASATGGAAPNQAQDTQGSNGSAPPNPGATSAAPPAQRITTGSAALARRL
ncbi:EAL domain-containing protein [Bradyrhizobium diazoefficiens]|nr:EAL domain-containing protein [Bradyrhizobium diazoefficiens]MBR0965100.1 EAL domain-containing protein [Bradyrhizobium diazoefficiens]MBR0977497.1 EAL domain-containing protein [Bradyrhizobium diazoefficiens]MBR1007821.1 EAL domain-containing protein [Bradyrhizobium diazoefficiens]MBR1013562.1 EAL domain-containing protein [Bradyrhizobium diazoefficiens]MBR1050654.1 EAL domain-containing protein [Bradyrhizobium diazoefficiens]